MASELTARDACLIIKAGKDAGARSLSFRGLIVQFGEETPKWPERPAPAPLSPADAVIDPAEKYLDKMEMEVKDQQLAEFLIDDPLELENLIVQDELRDESHGSEA